MERESSKECSVSFLWTNENFLLWNCLSRNSTLFSSRRSVWLVFNKPRQRGQFSEETSGTFCTLWSRKVFKREFFVFIKVSWTFSAFWYRCERKPQNVPRFEFCLVLSLLNLRKQIHDPVSATWIAFKVAPIPENLVITWPYTERATVRPHHEETNVYSHTFSLVWEPNRKLTAHQCCNQLTAV